MKSCSKIWPLCFSIWGIYWDISCNLLYHQFDRHFKKQKDEIFLRKKVSIINVLEFTIESIRIFYILIYLTLYHLSKIEDGNNNMFQTVLCYFSFSLGVSALYTSIPCCLLLTFWFFYIFSANSNFHLPFSGFRLGIRFQGIFIVPLLINNNYCLLNVPLPILLLFAFFLLCCFGLSFVHGGYCHILEGPNSIFFNSNVVNLQYYISFCCTTAIQQLYTLLSAPCDKCTLIPFYLLHPPHPPPLRW